MILNPIRKGIMAIIIAISLLLGTTVTPGMASELSANPNKIVYPERANLSPDSFTKAGDRLNILYFHVDNLGFGELGSYGSGKLRGAKTTNIDNFAQEGLKLTNFAPESQCTPSRSALIN